MNKDVAEPAEDGKNYAQATANVVIGAILATALLPIIQRFISVRDVIDTSMAVISPSGKAYFFPHIQALRIIRRQRDWSFARLVGLSKWNLIKAILRKEVVYRIEPTWK